MTYHKIDDVVNVVISTAAAATPRDGFNIALILGKSTRITTTDRVKVYNGVAAMLEDGFTENDPEYKAALLYFSQSPMPGKVCIGVCADGETWTQAVAACKAANSMWYGIYIANDSLAVADHQAVATAVETMTAAYFYDDDSDAAKGNGTTDVFATLKGLSIHRSFGVFSKTPYAGAAALGFAMGANNGAPGSSYTMAYKPMVGVLPDDLSESDIANLANKNANYYITRGGTYNVLEHGCTADGTWFDELIGLDQLSNDIQLGCMDLLAHTKTKIPYTDPGAMQFVLACNDACDSAVRRGFIAPGIWDGPTILDLENGDALDAGYLNQAEPVADQPKANKSLRICPPIYCAVILAGAIHSVTIKVNVE